MRRLGPPDPLQVGVCLTFVSGSDRHGLYVVYTLLVPGNGILATPDKHQWRWLTDLERLAGRALPWRAGYRLGGQFRSGGGRHDCAGSAAGAERRPPTAELTSRTEEN